MVINQLLNGMILQVDSSKTKTFKVAKNAVNNALKTIQNTKENQARWFNSWLFYPQTLEVT